MLGAAGRDMLEEYSTYLNESLHPEPDGNRLTSHGVVSGWTCTGLLYALLEKAIKSGLTAKYACVSIASQTTPDVPLKLKEWVK